MRIGIFGTFDVENYGDLLFPLIAERELRQRLEDLQISRYSYHEKDKRSWPYSVRSLTELINRPRGIRGLDCLLIGGGHLIRFDKQVANEYGPPLPQIPHPTGYWLSPALAGIFTGRPVIWNAPGASDELPGWAHGLLSFALDNSAYVSVRDASSAEALRKAGYQGPCSIVPDTVFALARHFPRESLRARVGGLLSGVGLKERYLVIQAAANMDALMRTLQSTVDLSAFDLLALPIGPVLGDEVSNTLRVLPQAKILPAWPSPEEIAGIIAHSCGVIGVSLHLSITALVYGLPVLRPSTLSVGKYAPLQLSENVYVSATEGSRGILAFAKAAQSNKPEICSLVTQAQGALSEHWDRVAHVCRNPRRHGPASLNVLAHVNLLLARQESLGQVAERDGLVRLLSARLAERDQQVQEKDHAVQVLSAQMLEKEQALQALSAQAEQNDQGLQQARAEAATLRERLDVAEQQFASLDSGLAVETLRAYRSLRDRALPPSSARRAAYELVRTGLQVLLRDGAASFARKAIGKLGAPSRLLKRSPGRGEAPPLPVLQPSNPYQDVYDQMLKVEAARPSPGFESAVDQGLNHGETPVKLIAFYLPQFHPIPENDEWWGRGFTDWANVAKAIPQFVGHYQPHLPGELGFYDLRVPEVQRSQVQLARAAGIYGFCFYYYWFGGRRLLDRPLQQFAEDPAIRFPFCVCWANENWTRRWDGRDDEVLIAHDHSPEKDEAFIRDLEPLLRHQDYMRIHGRPLILVYRPRLLPDPGATTARWREFCARVGLPEPYLVTAQVFEPTDPRPNGFDAAVEFPPNLPHNLPLLNSSVRLLNPQYAGRIHHYADLARMMTERPRPGYPLFKTVVPGWDNEARRPGRGSTFAFSTPRAYQDWLEAACRYALQEADPEGRMVFINAWNEWAEGAHLEPDRQHGSAYLQATAEALASAPRPKEPGPGQWKILVVSHNAHRGGAQAVLLNILDWLRQHTAVEFKILCLDGGQWLPRFEQLGETILFDEMIPPGISPSDEEIAARVVEACGWHPDLIYGNSVAAGRSYRILGLLGSPILTHLHELATSIERYAAPWISDVLALSSHFIACSEAVRCHLILDRGVGPERITRIYEGIVPSQRSTVPDGEEKSKLRKMLGLKQDAKLVIGCGLGMAARKGADLFIEVAREVQTRGDEGVHFYWLGGFADDEPLPDGSQWRSLLAKARRGRLGKRITFLGWQESARDYFRAADAFLLTSREDPFPLVALEAAEAGLPIVCFADAGGASEFVGEDAGIVVPFEDTMAMAEAVLRLARDETLRRDLGKRASQRVAREFTTAHTVPAVFSTCRRVAGKRPAVSVIVPNYNHAKYLPTRLDSIFSQTFQDMEVILLDDASSDESLSILRQHVHRPGVQLVRNASNSGSPFRQWLKGLDLARGEIVWISESDDSCEPDYLSVLLPAFETPRLRLAYSNSLVIDESGTVTGDYLSTDYLRSLSSDKWNTSYQISATQEVNDGLGIKNTMLSASAVLFRRPHLNPEVRSKLEQMKLAGDWYLALYAIRGGDVRYEGRALNYHRRHKRSVIGKLLAEKHVDRFFEELRMCHEFAIRHFALRPDFPARWEAYLRRQWDDFFPGRRFEEIGSHYPYHQLVSLTMEAVAMQSASAVASTTIPLVPSRIASTTYASSAEKLVLDPVQALYVVIPKTGCTTVKKFFSDWHGWNEVGNVHNPDSEIYQHIVHADLRTPRFEGYYRFTFVRNPFSRLYSAFKSKVRPGVVSAKWIDGVEVGLYKMGVRKDHSFNQFVRLMASIPDELADPHVKSQWQFIVAEDGTLLIDEWFFFEAFPDDFRLLLKRLGFTVNSSQLPHENRTQATPGEYAGAYDDETAQLVIARYDQDFRLFGYPMAVG